MGKSMTKGLLIYNTLAHGGKLAEYVKECTISEYKKANIRLIYFPINSYTSGFGNLTDIIKQEMPDHVLIAGGDGSLNKYINYAISNKIDLPIGIIPSGTANDFAKSADIQGDIKSAIRQIIQGTAKYVDIAKINNEYFINVFSCGYLTCTSHTTPDRLKKYFGRLAYFLHGVHDLFSICRMSLSIKSDDIVMHDDKLLILLVLNGKTAGKMQFARNANVHDGKLDVIIIKGENIFHTLKCAIKVLLKKDISNLKDVIYFKSSNITIDSAGIYQTDVDGDIGPRFPLRIECISDKIRIIS